MKPNITTTINLNTDSKKDINVMNSIEKAEEKLSQMSHRSIEDTEKMALFDRLQFLES